MGEPFHSYEDCIERARHELFLAFDGGEIDRYSYEYADKALAES